MFSAIPEFVFWGPKIKQFCVNNHMKKENWGKKMASGGFPENLRKIEPEFRRYFKNNPTKEEIRG